MQAKDLVVVLQELILMMLLLEPLIVKALVAFMVSLG
ncbi:hypothetical protein MiTs_02913 [Microcystis aeruginosa NIES-2521]|uniref:Uncharacterized protein n=1 Tax=Microcystis aeruginosa NIES-2521 TaxID=2303983 RepID=A0A5A5RWQ3_MICAE|nr:hypothetical protein MiTs_02913 [Microcystis aeruginosa NIES-2521]